MSIYIFPSPRPANIPSGPVNTSRRAAVLVTMVNTTSAVSATAFGDSPQRIPASKSHCAFDFVRLYPVTAWPAARSRFVTRPPMAPNPTNPRLAITTSNQADLTKQLTFVIGKTTDIFANLPQVRTHSSASSLRVTPDNAFKNTLVMYLPALGSTLDLKDLFALFAQQVNYGVYEDKNKRVLGCLRQCLVKTVIGCNILVGVVQTFIHHLHCLAHRRNLFLRRTRSSQGSNLSLKNLAHFNQIIRAAYLSQPQFHYQANRVLHSFVRAIDDNRSSAGAHIDQPFLGQYLHCFTHCRTTDVKLFCQFTFSGQAIPTVQFTIQNAFFDLLSYLLKNFDRLNW